MNAFAIQWDGTMNPCSSLFHVKAYPLQNGFEAAWKTIHEAALRYPIPAECEACEYKGICFACPAIHAEDTPPGHASPRQCLRARRLVESGLVRLELSEDKELSQETKQEEKG